MPKIYELGRLLITLFFFMREENLQTATLDSQDKYKRQGPFKRDFGTIFGLVTYWRTYIYWVDKPGGYFPLDIALGLPLDGFSMLLRSFCVNLATKISYAQTVATLSMFLHYSPCQKTVGEMVLGLGQYTEEWFEKAPAPEGDGEVCIIQVDSKGTPTATEKELKKRRGKRKKNSYSLPKASRPPQSICSRKEKKEEEGR